MRRAEEEDASGQPTHDLIDQDTVSQDLAAPQGFAEPESRSGWVVTGGVEPSYPTVPPRQTFSQRIFERYAELRSRLSETDWGRRALNWAIPLLITLLGAILRLWHLGAPHELIFDETYYPKDAASMIQYGYEQQWPDSSVANPKFVAGDIHQTLGTPEFQAHPPLGKWMIGFGEWLFGPGSSVGWRISGAVCSTIAVFLMILVARRVFRSAGLANLAGFFLAVEGQAIVMGRTGLLDIFVMFWTLAGFLFVLIDRDKMDDRLSILIEGRDDWVYGPSLGARWYLVAAGVCMGAASSVKWNGIYFLAAFGVLVVACDLMRRKKAGIAKWWVYGLAIDGLSAFLALVPVAVVTYLLTWTGWFIHSGAYGHAPAGSSPLDVLSSWWTYETQVWQFNVGLSSSHPYQATPLGWLVQLRPTAFYTSGTFSPGQSVQIITALGNVAVWWIGIPGLLVVLYQAIRRQDTTAWVIFAGYLGGYVPWMMYLHRTVFTFYTVAFVPFVVLAIVYMLYIALGRGVVFNTRGDELKVAGPPVKWVQLGQLLTVVVTALVIFAAIFWWPIWTGQPISYEGWRARMWLSSWI